MKLFNLNYKYYLLLLFPLLLIACDNDSDPVPPPTLTSIQISTDETTGLPVGYIRQYTAIGVYSDNSQKNITDTVAWVSSTTASATISTTGVATAVSVGSSEISATSSGITSTSITLTVTNATAVSLVIDRKQSVELPIRRFERLSAFIVFSDYTVIDVTRFVSWSSSQTGVITVNNTFLSPSKGEIFAVSGAANSDITATDPNSGAITSTGTIATSNATLTEIIIDPAEWVSLPKGITQEYTAQGLFSDGITRDLDKSRLAWESVNNTIATFIEDGLLQAKSVGETRVNVIDNDQGIIKTRATTVSVTDAVKVAVVTVPVEGLPGDSVQIPVGHNVQYQAYSVYSDGSFIDTTYYTTFTSSDTSITEKINYITFKGKGVGNVTITASDQASGLKAEPVELEVTSAVLETMYIYPNYPQISPGEKIQLTVFGSFSDGSNMDLTKIVSWSSDNQTVAAVSNSELTKGLVTGREPGSANITAAVDENTSIIAIVNVIR